MHRPYRKSPGLMSVLSGAFVDLPAPVNLSYAWNFGSSLGGCMVIQIFTGVVLAMHYVADTSLAFGSCVHILQEVEYGWWFRYVHANFASWFFICLYLHVGRGLFYGGYFLVSVWLSGLVLFMLSMMVAFLGYVLPWGQMSYWGATVITNLLSAVPYVGGELVVWVWGGFSIGSPTLCRFFVLHFLTPLFMVVLAALHLLFLHKSGSSNPIGVSSASNKVKFHWLYVVKDLYGFMVMLSVAMFITLFKPSLFSDPENWMVANPMITPEHIKPEWYFLWAYAILRAIPNKFGGIVAMFGAFIVLFFIPLMSHNSQSSSIYPWAMFIFWCFVFTWLGLGWLGSRPVVYPFDFLGLYASILYYCSVLLKWGAHLTQDSVLGLEAK